MENSDMRHINMESLGNKTIAVTGATGFLGRYFVRGLHASGANVVAVVRNPDKVPELKRHGIELRIADLADRTALSRAFAGCDAVIANAGQVSLSPDYDELIMQNVEKQAATYGVGGTMYNATSDRWLVEGDTVTVAGHTFEILHVPGHSPGSVVFFNRKQRFCLMGDVLFQGSVGRTDLPGGSHDLLIDGIKTKILPLGDDVAFICGHGPTSTIGDERETNPFIA